MSASVSGHSRDRQQNAQRSGYLRAVPDAAGRVPPADLDAEAAVLSACMLSSDALDQALDLLRPEFFYSDANGRIFEAIGIAASRGPVDITIVAGILRDKERFAQVGGAMYLSQIADATPAVAHVRAHAERVVALAQLRTVIATCQRVAAEGYGSIDDIRAFLEAAQSAIETACTVGARTQARAVGDVIYEVLATAQKQVEAAGRVTGLATGLECFDDATAGLHRREVMLLKGREGGGKSSLARQFGLNVAKTLTPTTPDPQGPHIQEFVYFGIADSMTEEQVTLALACTVAGVPENLIRTKMIEPSQWSDLYRVAAWLKTLPFIVHSDPKLTISALRAELRMWRSKLAKNGWWCEACGKRCPARLALVVADTVQVFAENEPTIDHDDGDFKKVGRVGRAMLKIAKDFDVSGVLISQIKDDGKAFFGKALKGHVQTEVHVKTQKKPSDLAVYKDKVSAQLVIEKQRHGPDTSVSVSFEKRLTRFVE